jgi:hypothetical protein
VRLDHLLSRERERISVGKPSEVDISQVETLSVRHSGYQQDTCTYRARNGPFSVSRLSFHSPGVGVPRTTMLVLVLTCTLPTEEDIPSILLKRLHQHELKQSDHETRRARLKKQTRADT